MYKIWNWIKAKFHIGDEGKTLYKVRDFDLKQAEGFLSTHERNLETLAFVMLNDWDVWESLVEKGQVIKSPRLCNKVDGVSVTFIDYPCLYYKFKGGEEGLAYCYREWESSCDGMITRNFGYKKTVFRKVDRDFRVNGLAI